VQQTASCNAVYDLQARICMWLLRMHDLAGVDFPLTQEFLAQMIGVRRTSVTDVASELQKAGMILYSRGSIHIENIEQIRASACECEFAALEKAGVDFQDDGKRLAVKIIVRKLPKYARCSRSN
jgi:hypothetical protein